MSKIQEVKTYVEKGKPKIVPGLVQEALDAGDNAEEILEVMIDAMNIVGNKFSAGELFVPEMLLAAKAMSGGVEVLKPYLASGSGASLGTCVIGTVEGDMHDIGKNLVGMMIESVGFEVVDLGVDVPKEKFIEAVKENDSVKIVACSALLTTTMLALKDTVKALREMNSKEFKIMVGGAPVTNEYAMEINADAYAADAGSAAAKAKELATA